MESEKIIWKKQLMELLVVFIGITLAFALNNWREQSKNRELEQLYIKSFYKEIVYASSKLDTIILQNKAKSERIKIMIPLMQSNKIPLDSIMTAIQLMAEINLFIGNTNTYESIKNSGNFNLIQKFKTRTKIIDYYESFKGKELVENYYRMYLDNYSIPFILENIDLLNGKIINAEKIQRYKFNNLIVGYYQLLIQVIDNYESVFKLNQDLKKVLEFDYSAIL